MQVFSQTDLVQTLQLNDTARGRTGNELYVMSWQCLSSDKSREQGMKISDIEKEWSWDEYSFVALWSAAVLRLFCESRCSDRALSHAATRVDKDC